MPNMPKMPKLHKPAFLKKKKTDGEAAPDAEGDISLGNFCLQLWLDNYDPNSNFPPKLKWLFLKY